MSQEGQARVHATLISLARGDGSRGGILLFGVPGAGKSDVALRLIDGGAMLVADDQVDLTFGDGGLWGSAPEATAGLIEARGIGLIRLPHEARSKIAMAVDLDLNEEIERMPVRRWYQPPEQLRVRAGALRIPLYTLNAREAATPAKIRAAFLGRVES